MDIKRVAIDAVNERIVMNVVHMDHKRPSTKNNQRKNASATVKGFRKGQVPKALVEKKYGRQIKIQEVQKC
jgi:trigger factor